METVPKTCVRDLAWQGPARSPVHPSSGRGPQAGRQDHAGRRQLVDALHMPCHYVSADRAPHSKTEHGSLSSGIWPGIRAGPSNDRPGTSFSLIDDGAEASRGCSETVERFGTRTRPHGLPIKVLLLGLSSLLVQRGLTETLAGIAFEVHVPEWHIWSWMRQRRTEIDEEDAADVGGKREKAHEEVLQDPILSQLSEKTVGSARIGRKR